MAAMPVAAVCGSPPLPVRHRCSLKLIYCHPHSCHGPCHLRCCHRRCCAPCQMCSECFRRRHGCSSPAALSCLLSTHWRSRWGPAGWRPAACEPAWAPYCGPKRGTAQGTHKPWLLVPMSLCLHLPPCPPAAAACLPAGPAAAAPRPVCAEPAAAGTGGQLPSDSGPPPPHPSHPRLWQQQRRRQPRDSHALCCRRRRPDWSPCGRHCSQGSCGARQQQQPSNSLMAAGQPRRASPSATHIVFRLCVDCYVGHWNPLSICALCNPHHLSCACSPLSLCALCYVKFVTPGLMRKISSREGGLISEQRDWRRSTRLGGKMRGGVLELQMKEYYAAWRAGRQARREG